MSDQTDARATEGEVRIAAVRRLALGHENGTDLSPGAEAAAFFIRTLDAERKRAEEWERVAKDNTAVAADRAAWEDEAQKQKRRAESAEEELHGAREGQAAAILVQDATLSRAASAEAALGEARRLLERAEPAVGFWGKDTDLALRIRFAPRGTRHLPRLGAPMTTDFRATEGEGMSEEEIAAIRKMVDGGHDNMAITGSRLPGKFIATLDAERGRREEAEKFIAEDTAALKSIQGALTDAGCAVGPQNGWGDAIRGLSARSRHLAGLLGELIACGDCDLCRDHKAALKGEKVTDGR